MVASRQSLAAVPAVLGVLAACGSPPPKGSITADVTHYDVTLDLDSRAAHAKVTAKVTVAGDCWQLPFRAQDAGNVELDGIPAHTFATDATTLTACGKGYKAGATLTLDADLGVPLATLGQTQVGFSTKTDTMQRTFYYLLSWVNECDRFTPCDHSPSAFATYHFDVTHQAAFTVRCPGDVSDPSPTETICDFGYAGGPTYSTFGVVAYPSWVQSDEGMRGDVHVTLYDATTTGIAGHLAATTAYHAGYVGYLESQFGPFPYGGELRVLTGPTYWAGFEHPTNIVLADNLYKNQRLSYYSDELAHTLDHEIAHMWAGDQTTLAGTYDFAWKESMAEYLPFTWEDSQSGAVALRTAGAWKAFALSAMYFPVPDDMPALVDYYGDVYGAGPMILFHQVEGLASRAQVLAALRSVLGTPHAISVDDVVAALSQQTGMDLTAYARAWLHGTGKPAWPQVDATFTPGTGTSTVTIHQTNTVVAGRGCKFHVALQDSATAPTQSIPVAIDASNGFEQTVQVATPTFTVAATVIDPFNECLVFPTGAALERPIGNPWRAERDDGAGF